MNTFTSTVDAMEFHSGTVPVSAEPIVVPGRTDEGTSWAGADSLWVPRKSVE
jgi:hypothetical protein